ncbi:MAG TPA: zinc ribbon domain-containing protein [Candidatus Dormibacteraeota bacterium]|nr:zinc ribbon domain-containing protein [Candidatus Dormibacteraeota bacterium]
MAERVCPHCGSRVRPTAQFCGRCRRSLGGAPAWPPEPGHAPAPVPPSTERPPRRRVGGWVLAGLLLLALVLGAIAYERLPTPAGAAQGTGGPPAPDTPPPTPVPTPVPTPSDDVAVLAALQAHWDLIRAHRFEEAYAYLGPDLAEGESAWVSSHQQDGIADVRYAFRVRDVSGDTATVDVLTLRTVAQSAVSASNPSGCFSWTGSYVLTRLGGRWLIDRANIHSGPC